MIEQIKNQTPAPAFYRKTMVCKKIGVSNSTLDRLIKKGIFPSPFLLGEPGYSRSIGWLAEEVETWISSRPRVCE
jgi:predicted DNA-binding transcriptional regulator AlpA